MRYRVKNTIKKLIKAFVLLVTLALLFFVHYHTASITDRVLCIIMEISLFWAICNISEN